MGLAYRLTFLLPPALGLVPAGRHSPCLHGCVLTIDGGYVSIDGPSRERVFEQAARFLKVHAKGHGPMVIDDAVLITPRRVVGGRDGWSIIIGAEVAFAPTSLGADIYPVPELEAAVASDVQLTDAG